MSLLAGEKVLITGAASGIGLAIAQCFAEQGATLALIDREAEALAEVAAQFGCASACVDVMEAENLAAKLLQLDEDVGGFTVLINNAGSGAVKQLHDYTLAEFDQLMQSNLYSVFYTCRVMIPLMLERERGAIVNIASETAERPTYGEAPYSAAKAGVVALTKSIAMEYGPALRCNAISPGVIHTPMTEGILAPEMIAPMLAQTPAGRVGSAAEVAQASLFLASDMSSYMTGQNLIVDGGLSLPQAGINDVTQQLVAMLEKAKANGQT